MVKISEMVSKPVEINIVVERDHKSLDFFFHGILVEEDKEKLVLDDFLSGKQEWNKSDIKEIHLMSDLEQKIFFAKYPHSGERAKLYEVDQKIKNRLLGFVK